MEPLGYRLDRQGTFPPTISALHVWTTQLHPIVFQKCCKQLVRDPSCFGGDQVRSPGPVPKGLAKATGFLPTRAMLRMILVLGPRVRNVELGRVP